MSRQTEPDLNEIMYYQELNYIRRLVAKLDISLDDQDHLKARQTVDRLKEAVHHIELSI